MEFCEFCGSILNDDGSCPGQECPTNAILEVLGVEKTEDPKVEIEPTKNVDKKEQGW